VHDWYSKISRDQEPGLGKLGDLDQDKSTYINIIINNNNNNNYMVNSEVSKLSKPIKTNNNRLSLVSSQGKDNANQYLLDFTHKYDKMVYCHRKVLKELTYPDVPPNSFDFDSFDVFGFLESIKRFQEKSQVPATQNLNIMTIDNQELQRNETQMFSHQLAQLGLLQEEDNTCSIGSKKEEEQHSDEEEKEGEIKEFNTVQDMKENATLQLRKIKFFWRGTQTNLPYIFKKIIFEKNIETGETEMFEKFEYSKKKIKTCGNENF
jgi:hypothetical protein